MSLTQDKTFLEETNNFQIKDSQRKKFMAEYREKRRKEKNIKTDIYDKKNIIYKHLFATSNDFQHSRD